MSDDRVKSRSKKDVLLEADRADVIGWDVKNWSRALDFWASRTQVGHGGHLCLELGAHLGGLSLWLAMQGNRVICSDLESPEKRARPLHEKYGCQNVIEYQSIDALNIGHGNQFDIVVFKSILGGVARSGKNDLKKKVIDEIYGSLKPGGKLLFVENLEATALHSTIRKRFTAWGGEWNYLKYDEIQDVFGIFERLDYNTRGFLGAFGPTEKTRRWLGAVDSALQKAIPKSKRYIVYGVAEKTKTH